MGNIEAAISAVESMSGLLAREDDASERKRYAQLAASLGQTPWHFLLQVKWPMLRASLARAFAVGFAVSVAQYLPTLYLGAGRLATVGTEAVALAAGGQLAVGLVAGVGATVVTYPKNAVDDMAG